MVCNSEFIEKEVLTMMIETQRLLIRDLKQEDEKAFVKMASDGSLNDVGFGDGCGDWMGDWISEAKQFAVRNNPGMDYLAYAVTLKEENKVIGSVGCSYYEDLKEVGITYFMGAEYRNLGYAVEAVQAYTKYFFESYNIPRMIATVRTENISSWKVVEKAGFLLTEKRMYKDINDRKEELYHFYEITA